MQTKEEIAKAEGYWNLIWLTYNKKEVLCGLFKFAFTFGLVVDIDEYGYNFRYCFPNALEAIIVLNTIKEIPSDPSKLEGNWIKCKGLGIEIVNPNFK